MKPFTAPINDRSREMYGRYMPRYETVPSMRPFDADIGERSRHLYGDYLARWSTIKVGYQLYEWGDANGLNWVDISSHWIAPTLYDIAMYRVTFYFAGWAGTPSWRLLVNDKKVYPFSGSEVVVDSATVYLGTLSTTIKTGETGLIQFKSDNAADGAGDTLWVALDFARLEPYPKA